MMNKVIPVIGVVLALVAAATFFGRAEAQQPAKQVAPLGLAYVELGPEYISRDGLWLKAFVPSGSTDRRVMISINEHNVANDRIDYVAANARGSDIMGPGVGIWAVTNSGKPFPKNASLHVTIMQPGATFGKPRPVEKPLIP